MEAKWGLLAPEFMSNMRRTRSLGLSASVRSFNDLAVPGLGGVWYGKQLLLSTLGVVVAEEARNGGANVQNIEVANSIEALACLLAFKRNNWARDARLRGNTKLHGKANFSFQQVRQRNFYVTQPMRMASVQALPALGFVESPSARFNAFSCSDEGRVFVELAIKDYRPYNRSVIEHLTQWVQMKDDRIETFQLEQALSPVVKFANEAELIPILRERIIQGGFESHEDKTRRANALMWINAIRNGSKEGRAWSHRPNAISEQHWHDLQSGALFFEARDKAIAVLEAIEMHIGNQASKKAYSLKKNTPDSVKSTIDKLTMVSNKYLKMNHADSEARKFCKECVNEDESAVVRALIRRDGYVLRLVDDMVKPGPAFRGGGANQYVDSEDDDVGHEGIVPLPSGISYRMRNLYLLNLDMHGELDRWLKQTSTRRGT